MSKEQKNPNIIVLNGKKFKATVFRIEAYDEKNRPEDCVLVPDDRIVELSDDKTKNNFMVCYVPLIMLREE